MIAYFLVTLVIVGGGIVMGYGWGRSDGRKLGRMEAALALRTAPMPYAESTIRPVESWVEAYDFWWQNNASEQALHRAGLP